MLIISYKCSVCLVYPITEETDEESMNRNIFAKLFEPEVMIAFATVILLTISAIAVFTNLVLFPFLIMIAILGTVYLFKEPRNTFFLMIAIRIVIDLSHVLKISVGPFSLMVVFSGASSVFFTYLILANLKNGIDKNPLFHPFMWYLGLLFVGAIRAAESRFIVDEFLRLYGSPLVLFVGVFFLKKKGDAEKLLMVMAMAGTIPLLSAIFHLLDGQMDRVILHEEPRLLGGYKNLRSAGLMSFVFSALRAFWVNNAKNWTMRIFFIVYFVVAVTYLFLTKTRATLIIFGVTIGIFYILTKRYTPVLSAIGLGFLIIIFNVGNIQDRFADFFLLWEYTQERNVDVQALAKVGSGRYGLWTNSFSEFLKGGYGDLLLGWGYGYHYIFTRANYSPFSLVMGGYVDVHNDFLRVLYEVGPFGVILFHGMMFMVVWYGLKLIKISKDPTHRDIGAMGIAVSFGFFTNQLLSNGINSRVTPAWGYWCFALAIFILLREYEEEARKKEPKNPRKNQLPDWQQGISHLPLIQIVQKERERNQQREQREHDEKVHVLKVK